ncbi:MAG: hypothetical protein WAS27_03820 [Candidatus Saccharimonadales bacterium]
MNNILIMNHQQKISPPIDHEQLYSGNDAAEIRQQEIDTLEALYRLPSTPENPSPEVPESQAVTPIETADVEYTSRQKIGSYLSTAALYGESVSTIQRLSRHFRARRAETDAKYAVHEGDSRFTRARKFMGRHATRIALGTFVGLGVGVAYGLRMEHAVEAMNYVPSGDIPTMTDLSFTQVSDTRYIVGGHLDRTGQGLTQQLQDVSGHGANRSVAINYPAEISPYPGDTHTLDESSKVASDTIVANYRKNKHETIEIVAHSEGTQGAIDAANRIKAEGGNVKLTLIAPPNGESGFFNTPYAKAASPVLQQAGITTDRQVPKGTRIIAYDTDFWANSNDKAITTQLSQLIGLAGDSHNVPVDSQSHITSVKTVDGITYETRSHNQGPKTAALRTVHQLTDIPVTKAMDDFGQAIAPQSTLGTPAHINPTEVINAGTALITEGLQDRGVQLPPLPIIESAPTQQYIAPIQEAIDSTTAAVEAAVPKEVTPIVNQVQRDATNLLNSLPKIG